LSKVAASRWMPDQVRHDKKNHASTLSALVLHPVHRVSDTNKSDCVLTLVAFQSTIFHAVQPQPHPS